MEKRRFNVRRNESDREKQSEVESVWETGQERHCRKRRQGKRGSEEETHKGKQQKGDSRNSQKSVTWSAVPSASVVSLKLNYS